jgi:hypothetical protein
MKQKITACSSSRRLWAVVLHGEDLYLSHNPSSLRFPSLTQAQSELTQDWALENTFELSEPLGGFLQFTASRNPSRSPRSYG